MAPGEEGELIIKDQQVMQGYWNRQDEIDQMLSDGCLCTGDLAVLDEGGYCVIADRKKDMIISRGCNIYPDEIDRALMATRPCSRPAPSAFPNPNGVRRSNRSWCSAWRKGQRRGTA
jgi:long-chain acyl-CoA synthetase